MQRALLDSEPGPAHPDRTARWLPRVPAFKVLGVNQAFLFGQVAFIFVTSQTLAIIVDAL